MSSVVSQIEIDEFNCFIENMEVIDVPILGKSFTWFNADGSSRSRLDRFLLFERLISEWMISTQRVCDRDISYHILLSNLAGSF